MTIIYADLALLPGGWGKNVCVALGDDGCISEVKSSDTCTGADTERDVGDIVDDITTTTTNKHTNSSISNIRSTLIPSGHHHHLPYGQIIRNFMKF